MSHLMNYYFAESGDQEVIIRVQSVKFISESVQRGYACLSFKNRLSENIGKNGNIQVNSEYPNRLQSVFWF